MLHDAGGISPGKIHSHGPASATLRMGARILAPRAHLKPAISSQDTSGLAEPKVRTTRYWQAYRSFPRFELRLQWRAQKWVRGAELTTTSVCQRYPKLAIACRSAGIHIARLWRRSTKHSRLCLQTGFSQEKPREALRVDNRSRSARSPVSTGRRTQGCWHDWNCKYRSLSAASHQPQR